MSGVQIDTVEVSTKPRGWQSSDPGLRRRHVKSIRVYWDDKPPSFIRAARLVDLFEAMRVGFEAQDRVLLESEVRLKAALDINEDDDPARQPSDLEYPVGSDARDIEDDDPPDEDGPEPC